MVLPVSSLIFFDVHMLILAIMIYSGTVIGQWLLLFSAGYVFIEHLILPFKRRLQRLSPCKQIKRSLLLLGKRCSRTMAATQL